MSNSAPIAVVLSAPRLVRFARALSVLATALAAEACAAEEGGPWQAESAPVAVGADPLALALDPGHLYVAGSGKLMVVDLATNTVARTVSLGYVAGADNSVAITTSPDHTRVYAASGGSKKLLSIPTDGGRPQERVLGPDAEPGRMVVSPDGASLRIADRMTGAILALSTTDVARASISVEVGTAGSGGMAWVDDTVDGVGTTLFALAPNATAPDEQGRASFRRFAPWVPSAWHQTTFPAAPKTKGLSTGFARAAYHPWTDYVVATDLQADRLRVFRTDGSFVGSVETGDVPSGLAFRPRSAIAYVITGRPDSLQVFSIDRTPFEPLLTAKVTEMVLPCYSSAVAFSEIQPRAFVSCGAYDGNGFNGLLELDAITHTVVRKIPLPEGAGAAVWAY